MFRKIKKKPVASTAKRPFDDTQDAGASRLDDPEDPGEQESLLELHKKKQRRSPKISGIRTGTMGSTTTSAGMNRTTHQSHSFNEASDTNRTTVRVQKRPRSTGLGYGGGSGIMANQNAPITNDTTSQQEDSNTTTTTTTNTSHNRYDANSLSQLRQQQQGLYQPQQVTPDDEWDPRSFAPDTASGSNENPSLYHNFNPNENNDDDDDDDDDFGMGRNFIPIDENPDSIGGSSTVLAGDEAFQYADNETNELHNSSSAGRTMDSVVGGIGGNHSVETTTTTTMRGGGQDAFGSGTAATGLKTHNPSSSLNPSLTLHDVHQHFSQTQERLKQQADELEKSLLRRQEAKTQAMGQADKHRQDLKSTGSSLEFYQTWRRDLIAFVGALREITKALPDMQTAWHELEQDMAGIEKWTDWEDDTFAVLTRYKLIHSVVGRHPKLSADVLTGRSEEVDEFGRDIVSHKQRMLHQRRVQRRNTRKEAVIESGIKKKMGAESGADESVPPHLNNEYAYPGGYPVLAGPAEMESFRERNKSLQNALQVVLDNLYEEYTSLPQLFELFAQWKRSFPAEYKECYASLTLADLATVLILVELLSLNDPLNESGGHDEAKWITSVCRFYHDDKQGNTNGSVDLESSIKLFDKESIERLVSKAVLPTLQDLLSQKRTYNLLSARQSKALSGFLSNAQRLLPGDHPVLRMLQRVVVDYIQHSLQELSIPLIVQQKIVMETFEHVSDPEEKELLGQTIHDATIGQIERVKKIMLNLFDCWAKMLPPESGFPLVMLQFMSAKVVPLLSALQTWYWPSLAESPSDVFLQLWQEVKKHDWLDRPENMVHSTVLKATAAAFRVDQVDRAPVAEMSDLASDPIIQQGS